MGDLFVYVTYVFDSSNNYNCAQMSVYGENIKKSNRHF